MDFQGVRDEASEARAGFVRTEDEHPEYDQYVARIVWPDKESVIAYLQTKVANVDNPGLYIVKFLAHPHCQFELQKRDTVAQKLSKFKFEYTAGVDVYNRPTTAFYNGREYLKDGSCTTFHAIVFAPDDIDCQKPENYKCFNLYRGMAFTPEMGFEVEEARVAPFIQHLELIMAAGDATLGDWLKMWLAHIIQHPGTKSGCCALFRSPQGTGKGVFFNIFARVLGKNLAVIIDSKDRLVGNFNSHLMNKLLVIADEVMFGGEHATSNKLKSLITSDVTVAEKKGVDAISIKSCERYAFLSNEKWPLRVEGSDRRTACFEVSKARVNDRVYFGNLDGHYRDEENLRHLFHYFHQYRCPGGEEVPLVFGPPESKLKQDLRAMTRDDYDAFLLDMVNRDNGLEDDEIEDGGFVQVQELLVYYRKWLEANGKDPKKASSMAMSSALRKYLNPKFRRVNGVNTRGFTWEKDVLVEAIS